LGKIFWENNGARRKFTRLTVRWATDRLRVGEKGWLKTLYPALKMRSDIGVGTSYQFHEFCKDFIMATPVIRMSQTDKIGEAIRRSFPHLGPEVSNQLAQLLTPQALAIVAGFLIAWVVSHAIGIGMIVDVIFLAVGVFAIGLAVFDGIHHLERFATIALSANSEPELDTAGRHFAQAVSILGVQAILALLLRNAPRTYRGGAPYVGAAPRVAGMLARPGLRGVRIDPTTGQRLAAGEGFTTSWGEILISRFGSATDRRLAALHEAVHRALTPKLNILRQFRVQNRDASYSRSNLSRYLEEALAESFALVNMNGIRGLLTGIGFPVHQGYVTLVGIAGVLPEAAGLLAGSFNAGGQTWRIYFSQRAPENIQ
jgi:hypothetical protein